MPRQVGFALASGSLEGDDRLVSLHLTLEVRGSWKKSGDNLGGDLFKGWEAQAWDNLCPGRKLVKLPSGKGMAGSCSGQASLASCRVLPGLSSVRTGKVKAKETGLKMEIYFLE